MTANANKFNVKYTEFKEGVTAVQTELKKAIDLIKQFKLASKAKSLYRFGNKKCYIDDELIEGIDDMDKKMEDLEWFIYNEDDLKAFISDLNIIIKK